jgi:methionyl-tRNA formyltransferase
MRPEPVLDAGPVCLQAPEPIRPVDDYGTLSARLEGLSGELLLQALDTLPPFAPQPTVGVTFAPKITSEDRQLDPERPRAALERRVRALTPHIGAWVEAPRYERLGVHRAALAPDELGSPGVGELASASGRLLLGCADGALELVEVQPPGGRPMPAAAYLRGHAAHPLGKGA